MKIRRSRACLNLGSISHGTARQEDLIPALMSTLDAQRPRLRSDRTIHLRLTSSNAATEVLRIRRGWKRPRKSLRSA